jgi:hypothetical protein
LLATLFFLLIPLELIEYWSFESDKMKILEQVLLCVTINQNKNKEFDDVPVSRGWYAITKVKQQRPIIVWVIKNLLSRAPYFGKHVHSWFCTQFTLQTALGSRGYHSFF